MKAKRAAPGHITLTTNLEQSPGFVVATRGPFRVIRD